MGHMCVQPSPVLRLLIDKRSARHPSVPCPAAQTELRSYRSHSTGVDQTDDMRRFLWNNHFSALVSCVVLLSPWTFDVSRPCSDTIAFECLPTQNKAQMIHNSILGLWGCPIGELWDLEGCASLYLRDDLSPALRLSKLCEETKRYTFFFNSLPLMRASPFSAVAVTIDASKVIGGVSSPPCAQAMF